MEDMTFNERLRHYRMKSGLTQRETSERLKVSRTVYSAYENGRAEPPLCIIRRLSHEFGVTMDELIGEK